MHLLNRIQTIFLTSLDSYKIKHVFHDLYKNQLAWKNITPVRQNEMEVKRQELSAGTICRNNIPSLDKFWRWYDGAEGVDEVRALDNSGESISTVGTFWVSNSF